ncbi:hypothetical protein [Amycolatopsis taiwanensis]|uniref:LppX_LprAFG lipoprotein n=1 Tax=Amycolatopsis taiwanensis TaxID=342230 RepID=A0A9W6QYT4_9PSEU|nr:hypothetical protein [Amycolatopsis taiwanensis]GLY64497.1 hypothetical protein Atai01_11160 [Amycolatopsis taiwanensis]
MNRAMLAVGGLALLVTVGACGTSSGTGQASPTGSDTLFSNAQELVRVVSTKTGQAKSTRFTLTETIGSEGTIVTHGEGRFGADPAMGLTINVLGLGGGFGGQELELRFVGPTVYLKIPPKERAKVGGKPWARITDNQLGEEFAKILDMTKQNDPTKILDQIQQAGTITKSEKTTLDGQPASHYWVDIDFAKATESLATISLLPAEEVQKLVGQVKAIPMELWLNQDSLPVQITEDLTEIAKVAGEAEYETPMNIRLTYDAWGTPVDIQDPPADQLAN